MKRSTYRLSGPTEVRQACMLVKPERSVYYYSSVKEDSEVEEKLTGMPNAFLSSAFRCITSESGRWV